MKKKEEKSELEFTITSAFILWWKAFKCTKHRWFAKRSLSISGKIPLYTLRQTDCDSTSKLTSYRLSEDSSYRPERICQPYWLQLKTKMRHFKNLSIVYKGWLGTDCFNDVFLKMTLPQNFRNKKLIVWPALQQYNATPGLLNLT